MSLLQCVASHHMSSLSRHRLPSSEPHKQRAVNPVTRPFLGSDHLNMIALTRSEFVVNHTIIIFFLSKPPTESTIFILVTGSWTHNNGTLNYGTTPSSRIMYNNSAQEWLQNCNKEARFWPDPGLIKPSQNHGWNETPKTHQIIQKTIVLKI